MIELTSKIAGIDSWAAVSVHCNSLEMIVENRERIVYLSPDAAEPLSTIERGKVYVIGGICDRARVKVPAIFSADV